MRLVPIVLLGVNILVAVFFFLIEGRGTSRTSEPLRREIRPEAIRIVATDRESPVAPAPRIIDEPREPTFVCASWGGFPESQVAAAENRLAPLELGARLSRSETSATTNYLVIIPPIAHRPDLNARVEALRRSGITDQFVINDGDLRNGISLGFFKSEEAATRHLAELQTRGVSDAIVKPRPSGNLIITLQIRDLTAAERTKLEAVAIGPSGVELKFQPCTRHGTPG